MGLGVLNLIYSVSIIYLVRQEIKELNNWKWCRIGEL